MIKKVFLNLKILLHKNFYDNQSKVNRMIKILLMTIYKNLGLKIRNKISIIINLHQEINQQLIIDIKILLLIINIKI